MDGLDTVAGALAGIAAGGALGFLFADRRVRGRAWLYWLANVLGVLAGVAVAAIGVVRDASWLWVGGVGLIGGWVTGLKYGYARNPGAKLLRRGVRGSR
ncbi:MAG: hypothetical protein IBX62_05560 [Coriobacteriia bacterium]|nr:hypothetical protein [Coriobacteriia bacterium]